MYAIVKTGGKQYQVTQGQTLDVELLGVDEGEGDVILETLMVVDGADVLATPAQLASASVSARVVGESKGPKIRGMVYKSKKHYRRRWGHRQHYTTIEIVSISKN